MLSEEDDEISHVNCYVGSRDCSTDATIGHDQVWWCHGEWFRRQQRNGKTGCRKWQVEIPNQHHEKGNIICLRILKLF